MKYYRAPKTKPHVEQVLAHSGKPTGNTACAYGRVSTDHQEQSLAAQTVRLRDYATRETLTLAPEDIYLEEDVSGAIAFSSRPRAGLLLRHFRAGHYQHLIVP